MPLEIPNLGEYDAVVFESLGSKEVCAHHVKVESARGREHERQRRTMSGFRRRMQRHFSEHLDKVLSNPCPVDELCRQYRVTWSFDWDTEQLVFAASGHDLYPNLPVRVHASPFDFYEFIGFDYKANRFKHPSSAKA